MVILDVAFDIRHFVDTGQFRKIRGHGSAQLLPALYGMVGKRVQPDRATATLDLWKSEPEDFR